MNKKKNVTKTTMVIEARITLITEGNTSRTFDNDAKKGLADILKKQLNADDVIVKDAKSFCIEEK